MRARQKNLVFVLHPGDTVVDTQVAITKAVVRTVHDMDIVPGRNTSKLIEIVLVLYVSFSFELTG